MKREIIAVGFAAGRCCPGHDIYPADTYRSRHSKRARARDKKREHQHARSILNREMLKELQ